MQPNAADHMTMRPTNTCPPLPSPPPPPGAVRKLHLHPVRGVASGQSVCLRRRHDDGHQRVDAAQFPAGAAADAAGGAAGAPAEQRAHTVQVSRAFRRFSERSNVQDFDVSCFTP